jgi:hypothetical protein
VTDLRRGDTVFMPQVQVRIPHLWIVATEPLPATGESILVNVTTLRSHSDKTLVLNRGDHPFIYKESVVSFGDSIIAGVRLVAAGIDNGLWPQREPCSEALIQQIQIGILASPRTPAKVKAFYRALASEPFDPANSAT